MALLDDLKKLTEKATGWRTPSREVIKSLVQIRKPRLFRFKDDGAIPNHPRWPLAIYKSAVRFSEQIDPASIFEELFGQNGWGDSWRDGIYNYVHYHSRIHEVLGVARGRAKVQFGRAHGRAIVFKAGDVAVLPAGTGHECLEASKDLLVVGAHTLRTVSMMNAAGPPKSTRGQWQQCGKSNVQKKIRFTGVTVHCARPGPIGSCSALTTEAR
jgi:uncharacterized protein YjlB